MENMLTTQIVERYADGQTIVTEGIVSMNAYIILSGKVKVIKRVGDKNIVIGTLKQGDVFGEMGLIGDLTRTASVIAIGNVNLGIINKERFESLIKGIPDEARLIILALIERLKLTTEKLANFAIQFDSLKKTMHSMSTKTAEKER
jgi:CRP-like cAMP-binding protein